MTRLEQEIKASIRDIVWTGADKEFALNVIAEAAAGVAKEYIEKAMKYAASTALDKKVYSSTDSYVWLKRHGVI